MSTEANWIGPALTALIVPMALTYFGKACERPAIQHNGKRWVQYDLPIKLFTCAFVIIPVVFFVLSLSSSLENKRFFFFMGAFFGALVFPLFLEVMFVKVTFDKTGIYCYSPWRKNRAIAWENIGDPVFSPALMWWVIPTKNQGAVRLHKFISGACDLLAEIVNKTPNQRLHSTIASGCSE